MTVNELIEKLKEFPGELEVFVIYKGYEPLTVIREDNFIKSNDKYWLDFKTQKPNGIVLG